MKDAIYLNAKKVSLEISVTTQEIEIKNEEIKALFEKLDHNELKASPSYNI